MSATSTERPSSSKTESKKQKSALSRGNTTQAQKSNQAASSTVITVAAGQRLMSIPEQSFGDETASNIRTPEGRQPEVQGPPPVEPGMGPPQRRFTSMGYAQPASSPMGGFAYSPTWGTRGPPPGPIPQLDMESASNAGGRVSGQVAAIERIQGGSTDPLTVRQQEKLPERRVSPAVSEQSRTSSRRLPTPPVQSLNLPPPRRGSSLASLLKSPAMNTPNWERTHAIHHSRTNFPVQPLSEMTLRLEDVTRIQECIPEDVAMVLREVLESMGIEVLGDGLEFSDLRVQFLTVGTQLEIDLPEKAQQWLMTPANRSDFLWLYNVLLDPERMLELLEAEARYGRSFRNSRGILPLLPHTHGREKEFCGEAGLRILYRASNYRSGAVRFEPPPSRVNIPNYQAIQILRNANLAEAAAKIDEESNEDANAIAAKNRRRRRYTTAHLLAPVESMPDQDSPVRVRNGQTVYTYTPMRHMHQLLVRSEESEAMLCSQETRHRTLLAESDTLMLSEELSGSNLERALEFRRRLVADNRGTSYMVQCELESVGEFPPEQFDQKGQLHGSDGRFLAQKHSSPRNTEVPELLNPGNTATRSPQLRSGTSPTVHALAQHATPPPRVNLQTKPLTPVSTQRYQLGEVRMDGAQHSSWISGQDLTARLAPNPVHVPPRLSNPSVIPYQGSVSMQSQAVGTESQRGPNQRRTLAVHEEAVPPQGAPFGTPFVTGAQMNRPGMAFESARSQESVAMIQQQARVIETLQEQLREVKKGFTAGEVPTGGPLSKTGNTAGLSGRAPRVMREYTRGGPSPVVPQPRSWQATEPISFNRNTPTGARDGNPQVEQAGQIPDTPSVDRRRIHEWGARVQRAELGEYGRPEGGAYALENEGGGKGGFNPPPRVPPPHFSSQSRDRERPLSQGGQGQREQGGRSGGGAPPPPPPPPPPSGGPSDSNSEGSNEGEQNKSSRNGGRREEDRGELPTGAPDVPPTRYDPDQPWYYDPRQGWHRKTAPRPPNEGRSTWESNEEKNRITIESKLDVGKIESFAGDDRSAWKTWVLSLERMFGVRPTIYAREKDKCASAASHLTGAALSHFDTLNRQRLRGEYTCLEDWTEFKREFGSKFGPIDEADEARRRLAWMKQMPEESFANFFIRFNEYAPLTGFNDEALVTYLKKGVAPWLPLQVVTGREEPRSYDEWTRVFTKLDGAVRAQAESLRNLHGEKALQGWLSRFPGLELAPEAPYKSPLRREREPADVWTSNPKPAATGRFPNRSNWKEGRQRASAAWGEGESYDSENREEDEDCCHCRDGGEWTEAVLRAGVTDTGRKWTPEERAEKWRRRRQELCMRCGRKEHWAKDCPNPESLERPAEDQGSSERASKADSTRGRGTANQGGGRKDDSTRPLERIRAGIVVEEREGMDDLWNVHILDSPKGGEQELLDEVGNGQGASR
ncbi:hypothetical protein HHX47_DHR8000245 [Lentinula edodes]|nr:hypothetical protein HHX47_DHR8000245 [Lentinula edodes]